MAQAAPGSKRARHRLAGTTLHLTGQGMVLACPSAQLFHFSCRTVWHWWFCCTFYSAKCLCRDRPQTGPRPICIHPPVAQLHQPVASLFGISARHCRHHAVLCAGRRQCSQTPLWSLCIRIAFCRASPDVCSSCGLCCTLCSALCWLQAVFPDTSLASVYATTAARREAVAASPAASSSAPRRRQAHSLPQIVHAQGFDRYVSAASECPLTVGPQCCRTFTWRRHQHLVCA